MGAAELGRAAGARSGPTVDVSRSEVPAVVVGGSGPDEGGSSVSTTTTDIGVEPAVVRRRSACGIVQLGISEPVDVIELWEAWLPYGGRWRRPAAGPHPGERDTMSRREQSDGSLRAAHLGRHLRDGDAAGEALVELGGGQRDAEVGLAQRSMLARIEALMRWYRWPNGERRPAVHRIGSTDPRRGSSSPLWATRSG